MSPATVLWILVVGVIGYLVEGPVGAVFGAVVGGFFGFTLGTRTEASLGRMTAKHASLETRVADLERQLAHLRQRLAGEDEPQTAEDIPLELDLSVFDDALSPGESRDHFSASDEPAHARVQPRIKREIPAPEQRPSSIASLATISRLLSFLSGGNPVVRIGVILLFFGAAFLIRYAAERNLVPIELRLTGIAATAIAALVLGWGLRQRPGAYGLVLQGGAVGVLYLTVFAAARLYDVVPMALALALMVGLVILSAWLALMQDARWMALFGAAGGFLAPVLMSTGEGSHVALFSYYVLLNAGILGIAWFRAWRELNLAGFLFTFVVGSVWGYRYYRPEHFVTTEPFLILFFLFFVTISVLFALRQPPRLRGYVDGTLVFGVPIFAFGLQAALTRNTEYGLAYSALVVAAFYLLLAWGLWRRRGEGLRLLSEAFLALGVAFATLAVPLALDGRWTSAVWAVEGAALVWVGVRQQRLPACIAGLLLQLGAGVAFLAEVETSVGRLPLLNSSWLGTVAVSLAALFTARYLRKAGSLLRQWEGRSSWFLLLWGLAWWWGGGMLEIDAQVPRAEATHGVALYWALSMAIAGAVAHRLGWKALSLATLTLAPLLLLVLGIQLLGPFQEHALSGWGVVTWPFAVSLGYWVLWRSEDGWQRGYGDLWHALMLWLVTALLTWEIDWLTRLWIDGGYTWRYVAWALIPGFVVGALLRFRDHLKWPVVRFSRGYLELGLGVLVLYLYLWSLAANLASGDAAPLSYVPLLNPLDLTQLFALMTVGRWLLWYRNLESASLSIREPAFVVWPLGVGGFIWLNAVVARTVHFNSGIGWNPGALADSVVFQAALSILWSLMALAVMVVAHHKRSRRAWLVGAALLAVVVAKLFVIDLVGVGTLARIVSFVGVGVIMLAVGYFSPLPPRETGEEGA